jgi:hypothetical protein
VETSVRRFDLECTLIECCPLVAGKKREVAVLNAGAGLSIRRAGWAG